MGPEYYRPHAEDEEVEFDEKVRAQVLQGCRLVKELEEKLQRTPAGKLGESSSSEVLLNLAVLSMEIIAVFNETNKLLVSNVNSSPATSPSDKLVPYIALRPQKRPFSGVEKCSPDLRRSQMEFVNNAESPASTARNGETPPLSPAGLAAVTRKNFTPSPPRSSNSEMSDGCRARAPISERDTQGEAGAGRGEATDTAENDAFCIGKDNRDNTRKRKLMPKVTLRMPASNLEQGVEIPPDDGHTWRKYGQKIILCSNHPRSYYRCTHKPDLGCQAIKQVQRCDDDSSVFDVTYRGHHTCRSAQLDQQTWPFAFPHPLSQMNTQFIAAHGSNLAFVTNPSALSTVQQPAVVPFSLFSNMRSTPLGNTAGVTLAPARGPLDSLLMTSTFATGAGQIEANRFQTQRAGLREEAFEFSDCKNPAIPKMTMQSSFILDENQKCSSEDELRRVGAEKGVELHPKANDNEESVSSDREGDLQQRTPLSSSKDWSLRGANPEGKVLSQLFVSAAPSEMTWSAQQCPEPLPVRSFTEATNMQRIAECLKASSEEVPASSLFDDPMDLYPELQNLVPSSL